MPGRDRTGPEGEGPLTGRGAGPCADERFSGRFEPGPGFAGRPLGLGRFGGRPVMGRRGGGGRRWRHWFYATGVPGWARFADVPPAGGAADDDAEFLKARANELRAELDAIDQRLQELDK